jgi:cell division protein FtsQ
MSSGEVAWCLGSDDSWIEPISIDVADGQDLDEAALAQAQQMGVILISDVPSSVSPQAGSSASDETIEAVSEFQSEFSDDLSSQIVSYSASSTSSISCTLSSGLTISLGSASDIETKESIINSLIEKYPDRLTYINVRVTSSPSYRMIDSDEVQSGTGTSG